MKVANENSYVWLVATHSLCPFSFPNRIDLSLYSSCFHPSLTNSDEWNGNVWEMLLHVQSTYIAFGKSMQRNNKLAKENLDGVVMWYYSETLRMSLPLLIWLVLLEDQIVLARHIQQNTHSIRWPSRSRAGSECWSSERGPGEVLQLSGVFDGLIENQNLISKVVWFTTACISSSKSCDPFFWALCTPALNMADTHQRHIHITKNTKV